ncbi:hypothetical protein ACA910_014142 [Epithemia clementina (nom. ined.)]
MAGDDDANNELGKSRPPAAATDTDGASSLESNVGDHTVPRPLLPAAMELADTIHYNFHNHEEGDDKKNNKNNNNTNNNNNNKRQWQGFPGLTEGAVAGGIALLIVIPFRRMIPASLKEYSMFNTLLTVGQVLVPFQSALFFGSMAGSCHYLHKFTQLQQENDEVEANERFITGYGHEDYTESSPHQRQQQQQQQIATKITTICQAPVVLQALRLHQDGPPSWSNKFTDAAASGRKPSSLTTTSRKWWDPTALTIAEYQKALQNCRRRNEYQQQQRQQEQQQDDALKQQQQQQDQQQQQSWWKPWK